MATIPDLTTLLCLDAKSSKSPFGGSHRTILIEKNFDNITDFAFNSLLHHFSRKEPNTPVLLITASQDWTSYSASAARCGFNLRRIQNQGQIDVLNVMSKLLEVIKSGQVDTFNVCDFIIEHTSKFIKKQSLETQNDISVARLVKPVVIMIDDITTLLTIGCKTNEIFRLFSLLDKSLRDRSKELQSGHLSHFVVQTMVTSYKSKQQLMLDLQPDCDLNYLIANMENLSDICLTLKPLDTGYSTRVDGTIKIVDNRLPGSDDKKHMTSLPHSTISLFPESKADIGMKKAYFFKLSDRRVRLTTSALIF